MGSTRTRTLRVAHNTAPTRICICAALQGPLSRFGDTAANAGMLALLDSYDSTSKLPIAIKTLTASGAAAAFRIVLMPVDALKTTLQARTLTAHLCGSCMSIAVSELLARIHDFTQVWKYSVSLGVRWCPLPAVLAAVHAGQLTDR